MDDDGYNTSEWVEDSPTGEEWDNMGREDRLLEAARAYFGAIDRRNPDTRSFSTARMDRTLGMLRLAVEAWEPAEEI